MKHILFFTLCLTTALQAQQPTAAPHTFTSTDGRKLTATISEKTATTVTVRRVDDGMDFVLPLDRLSAADQALVKNWGTKAAPLVMADPALPESWVVQPQYASAGDFTGPAGRDGLMFSVFEKESFAGQYTKDKRVGLIRSDGLVLCDPDKDECVPPFFFWGNNSFGNRNVSQYFRDHRVLPKLSGGKYGLVDVDGSQVMPPLWDEVGSFSEGLFDFTLAGKKGYANLKGEVVIQPQWAEVRPFSGGYAIVRASKGGKQSVIDKTGTIISNAVWDQIQDLKATFSFLLRGFRVPDHVSIFEYRPAQLPPGLFWVGLNDKWGLYDMVENTPVGELQWDKLSHGYDETPGFDVPIRNPKLWVLKDGKHGMIDLTGNMVLEPVWETEKPHIRPSLAGNFIKACRDGKTAWWRLDGATTLPDGHAADFVHPFTVPFVIKVDGGKIVRQEKISAAEMSSRMIIRQGGERGLAGLADWEGNLLGEVRGFHFIATPSPDHFMVELYDPRYGHDPKHGYGYGLIDATGKEVEPLSKVVPIALEFVQISDPGSLPDGEIVAGFKSQTETASRGTFFLKTPGELIKIPSVAFSMKFPPQVQEAPGVSTIKALQKDGKWGYIRLIEAKP